MFIFIVVKYGMTFLMNDFMLILKGCFQFLPRLSVWLIAQKPNGTFYILVKRLNLNLFSLFFVGPNEITGKGLQY